VSFNSLVKRLTILFSGSMYKSHHSQPCSLGYNQVNIEIVDAVVVAGATLLKLLIIFLDKKLPGIILLIRFAHIPSYNITTTFLGCLLSNKTSISFSVLLV
jgi:hypothetical protein